MLRQLGLRASRQLASQRTVHFAPARTLATPTALPPKDCTSITPPYARLLSQLDVVRSILNRPLTLAEKILYSHLCNPEESLAGPAAKGGVRGQAYLLLNPDRVAMQDASAQMAILQFMTCGLERTAVPTSIHCDHLIQAYEGAEADLKRSIVTNKEVFDFLESAARKYGIAFHAPGSGIIHQIVLENYAAPGMLMLGTDSHTPNASGLGMLAIGVGGADAVDAMTATPWELKAPLVQRIHLSGQLSGWASPKDIILHLAGKLTVRGGTGSILEYSGPGLESISATGLATIANMGAEVGATTSAFAYTPKMREYLEATRRAPVARAADEAAVKGFLKADEGAEYDQNIEINLSELEPHLNGPFTPDLATPLSQFRAFASTNFPKTTEISAALIGSCTNSSYHDLSRSADIARQAIQRGLKAKTSFMVTPGSEQVRATVERDGIEETLTDAGATVLANACGPCIGQWDRRELQGEENVILTSFNRNFKARNDGNAKTMNFLASPEIVTAMAFAGRVDFNPMTDSLRAPDGTEFRFEPPKGEELPSARGGFALGDTSYMPEATPTPRPETKIAVDSKSDRLRLLEPFEAWDGKEPTDLPILIKVKGKCTTDHISAAGPWLAYKGHLPNISQNTLIGATNAANSKVNEVQNVFTGESGSVPSVAEYYRDQAKTKWIVIGDDNYGEGSAREHAALQPRYLGGFAIVVKSFARIHETNLKKQGVLPLSFSNPSDYERVQPEDRVSLKGIKELAPGSKVTMVAKHKDGSVDEIPLSHTMTSGQLEWFRAGSALNAMGVKAKSA